MNVLGGVSRHGDDSSLLLCSKSDASLGVASRLHPSGAYLELQGRCVAGERLRDPEVGADRLARVLDGLDLGRSARNTSGKVHHTHEITASRAMDGDAKGASGLRLHA